MIEPGDIEQKIKRLQALLKEKFRIDADDLRIGFKKAGRRLPARIHKSAEVIIDAQVKMGHPKLARLADGAAIDKAFHKIETHLEAIDVKDRRTGAVLGVLGSLVFNMIVVFALFMVVVVWRGLI